ncbi:Purine nucleoside phosphorylase 1 [Trichinella britovi]|uniref:Purine nucleoside phosphorylase n=1 Tax=Trichinella britovi TaxID=45882 RepID=A0A0V1CTH8_TRIBR|nr:Purine nucleoside phosphorylase 1 [Trichinella britovi]
MNEQKAWSFETAENVAKYIKQNTHHKPLIGIICGSGLGKLCDMLEERESIEYSKIPGFPVGTVQGHHGNLVLGKSGGKSLICMQGRVHPYEGRSTALCVLPIRVMKMLGVKILIITNAAGGANQNYIPGDIMLIKDHISLPCLSGFSPLVGPNDERYGTRFPSMNHVYDKEYRTMLKEIAKETGIRLREGVYMMVMGPQYETPAETRMLQLFGADAIGMTTMIICNASGMSSVHEAIAAKHSDMQVVGISLISNLSCTDCDKDALEITHEEVLDLMNTTSSDVIKLLKAFIAKLEI